MKQTKHLLATIAMLLCCLTMSAETAATGTCGDNLTWTLSDDGELIIEGTGAMTDYDSHSTLRPWSDTFSSTNTLIRINTVTIKEGVTTIGEAAFSDCGSLTSITIPESVTSIGGYAFSECTELTSINIPEGVTSIGSRAFYHCHSLTSINIPGSVTTIGEYAFYECWKLTSITIPEGVTTIGEYAFYQCSCLASITIPESVTTIGNYAFYDCSSLTSITSYAVAPPTCASGAFSGVNTAISVSVPESSVADYQTAEEWKEFTNFVGADLSGIDNLEIAGNRQQLATLVYDFMGRRVKAPGKGGVYIVNGKKIAIK